MLTTSVSTIWENTVGCSEQYRCVSALYLMSVISQTYSLIVDQGISAHGHRKEVVDGLNDVDKTVTKCTYWPVLGELNNWNIIEFSSKSTSSETFDEIHQVVLDGKSDDLCL